MDEHAWGAAYKDAMAKLEPFIKQQSDGTFLLLISNGREAGIDDPVVFSDLQRSLQHTNELIKRDEINPKDIRG